MTDTRVTRRMEYVKAQLAESAMLAMGDRLRGGVLVKRTIWKPTVGRRARRRGVRPCHQREEEEGEEEDQRLWTWPKAEGQAPGLVAR